MSTALAGVLSLAGTPQAYANPIGGQVVGGQANISSVGNTLTVQQTTSRAIINWSSFDIAPGEITQFEQPSSSSIALNRVTGSQNPSQILGTLNANGQVWIINPNGVMFGGNAQVNVAGLVATSADIDNNNFMAGNYTFNHPGIPNATVSNAGSITTADAGLVAFVAPNVSNAGLIQAKLGKVQLGSGDSFTLDLYGDGLINLQASPAITQQIVSNSGVIRANGGTVTLTAAAAAATVNSLVNMSGVIQAESIGSQNGQIVLYAEGSNAVQNNVVANKGQKQGTSTVLVSGTLDASGTGTGQTGGTITVTGDHVGILPGALIDASGDAGGGTIKIGGDFHGEGTTPTALATVVQSGALIDADALTTGNGGTVAVWADDYTNFAGNISARGGATGGNGGYVETSGHQLLSLTDNNGNTGYVDASAPNGTAGTWLLDPADLTITTSTSNTTTETNTPSSGDTTYIPNGSATTSDILNTTIDTALNAGTNVYLTTGGDAETGPNGGQITVSNPIIATTGTSGSTGSLTLSAYSNIVVNAAITLGGAGVTGGALTLQADNQANQSGYINISANVTTNGGNITMGGGNLSATGNNPNVGSTGIGYAWGNSAQERGIYVTPGFTVNAGAGNIIVNGHGLTNDQGVFISSSTVETTSGNITINGVGGTGSSNNLNIGVQVQGSTTTTTGNITINGTGGADTGQGSDGILVQSGTVESGGNVTLTGAGTGTGQSDHGVSIAYSSTVGSTGAGTTTITGAFDASSSGSEGIYGGGNSADTNYIGSSTTTGNIIFNADKIMGNPFSYIETTGKVIFAPITSTTTVGVAGGAGTLGITSNILGTITGASEVDIGSTADTNTLTAAAYNWGSSLKFITGSGSITLSGVQAMGSNNLILQSDTLPTITATPTGTGTLSVLPASATTSMGIAGGAGTLALSAAYLTSLGTNWSGYSFGRSDESGNMTVDAENWNANASFITGSGLITLAGVEAVGTHNLTLQSDTLPTISATPTGTGTLSVLPGSATTSMGIAGGSGTLALSTAYLTSLGTNWTGYSFGRPDESGNMTVDAENWNANASFITGSGLITLAGVEAVGAQPDHPKRYHPHGERHAHRHRHTDHRTRQPRYHHRHQWRQRYAEYWLSAPDQSRQHLDRLCLRRRHRL